MTAPTGSTSAVPSAWRSRPPSGPIPGEVAFSADASGCAWVPARWDSTACAAISRGCRCTSGSTSRSRDMARRASGRSRVRRRWVIGATVVVALAIAVVLTALGFRGAAAWRERFDAADVAPPTGHYVATRSGRIFLQEAGPRDGIAIVLFHGTAAWSELWRHTISRLASAGFRVIALDIPPFGFSDRPGSYTRTDQAARVRDVLDELAIQTAIIVGHSFGAGAERV